MFAFTRTTANQPQCTGNPTFDLSGGKAITEWPEKVSGFICKTPPIGSLHASRFAQCCSGKVYNITTPQGPESDAYGVSCAMFCLVDPKSDEPNEKYPYRFSEHFMCLTNGDEEASGFEVVCGDNKIEGIPETTSFESTWTGWWQTADWASSSTVGPSSTLESVETTQAMTATSAISTSEALSETSSSPIISKPTSTTSDTANSTASSSSLITPIPTSTTSDTTNPTVLPTTSNGSAVRISMALVTLTIASLFASALA
ncbi:hypothetical protein GGR57DRAFT_403136 [Xylariaceae sp. FL1272]|nr:hypothetical protein GGR57DRAFT_403136 [Xylariaceae sp. FL1272]